MYTVKILRAKYSPEKRQILGILLIILLCVCTPLVGLFIKIPSDSRDIISLFFLFIAFFSVFLMFQIHSKIISKTFEIGTMEIIDQKLNIITNDKNIRIAFKDISIIKYKIGSRMVTGKTLPHSINNSALISIFYNDNDVCNIHIMQNVFKDGIKQSNYLWTADGNVFDILQRNKLKAVFDRELNEDECLKG